MWAQFSGSSRPDWERESHIHVWVDVVDFADLPGWAAALGGTIPFSGCLLRHMGRLDAAKATAERLRLLTPIVVGRTTQFRDPVQSELFLSGLRLAAGETRPPPAAFVAIFAANAAGYSRLTGVDAEATLAAIRDRL
jgi:hypothetical protein